MKWLILLTAYFPQNKQTKNSNVLSFSFHKKLINNFESLSVFIKNNYQRNIRKNIQLNLYLIDFDESNLLAKITVF